LLSSTNAQCLTRSFLRWATILIEHFDIHFPAAMSSWAERVASHIESEAAAVNQFVGNAPPRRVTVMVEDPYNVANGFALPFLDGPLIFLWPTPSGPSPS